MKPFLWLLVAASSLASGPTSATEPQVNEADYATIDAKADRFFKALQSGPALPALTLAFSDSRLMASKSDQLQLLASQIDGATKVYGPLHQCYKTKSSAKPPVAVYREYVCQHQDFLVTWDLTFFKPKSGWLIAHIFFKDTANKPE